MGHVGTRLVLCALACSLLLPPLAQAGTPWEHPWLHPRMLDYRHRDWGSYDELKLFGYITREAVTTLEHQADGSLRFIWDAVIDIEDPSVVPQLLELDSLSAARNTRVVAFEARFLVPGEAPSVLDRRRLVERAASQHAMYFDGDTVLSLIAPRERPGRLTIHLETLSEPHEGFEQYFGGVQFVQLNSACERRVVRLRVPAHQTLAFETRFVDVRPRQRVRAGVREYEFVFRHTLPFFAADAMPPSLDAFPSILYSNQPSWEALAAIVRAAWEPHLSSDPAMDAWAAELVADAGDDVRSKARAIHDAVADGWGYLGFYPGESGWIPHSARACYGARLGDCKDRTALMVALMRSQGIRADPTIIWSGAPFRAPDVPVIIANHAIVHVDPGDGGGAMYLDSVDSGIGADLLRESLSGRQALVLGSEPGLRAVPDALREHWLEEDEAFVSVQPDGSAEVFLVRHWHGQEASNRKEMHAGPNRVLWERALRERLAATYPEATVSTIVQHPHPKDDQVWRLEVTLRSGGFVQRTGRLGVVVPPWIVRWSRDIAGDGRRHPRVVQGSWFRSTVRVYLPAGVEVVRAPDPAVGSVGERLLGSIAVHQTKSEIALTLDVQSTPGWMEIEEEADRARFYTTVASWQDQSVVLRFPEEAP